jgi:hypothetical protein
MEKQTITTAQKKARQMNIAKAREARTEKAETRRGVLAADQQKLREVATVVHRLLKKVSTTYGNGGIDKRFCLGCEEQFIDLVPNACACQDAWKFVESVQETLGDG